MSSISPHSDAKIYADPLGDILATQFGRKPQLPPINQIAQNRVLSKQTALQLIEDAELRVKERRAHEERTKSVEELLEYFTKKLEEPWYLIMPDSKFMGHCKF